MLKPRYITTASLVAGALLMATSGTAFAVADGSPVVAGEYQFSTKLVMANIPRPDGSHYNSACSAALIDARWIITAGHCFHDVNRNPVSGPVPYSTTAIIGTNADNGSTSGYRVQVSTVYQAPASDIAIAELAAPVPPDIKPIALATAAPTLGEVLRITGWGSLTDVNPTPSTLLQTGQVSIASIANPSVGVVGYAPKPTTSACTYDSGAPYFRETALEPPVLVAVEGDGPGCPHDQVETTTRVDTLASWIASTIH